MKICPKCNGQIADDAGFCTACGAQLDAVASASVEPAPTTAAPAIPAKKKDTKFIALAIVAAVSLLLAIGALIFAVATITKNTNIANDTEPASENTVAASGVKAAVSKYEVTIPGNYQYEIQDDSLLIADEKGEKWAIALEYSDDLTFSLISNNIETAAKNMKEQNNFTEATAGVEELGKVEVPYIDVSDGTNKATYAFFEADDLHVFAAMLVDASGEYNHKLMKKAQKVLKTAKKKQASKAFGDEDKLFKGLDDLSDAKLNK